MSDREKFEAWARTDEGNCADYDLARKTAPWTDEYRNDLVQRDWEIWQARAALTAEKVAGQSGTVEVFDWLETELTAISCRYHGDPSYDHDAYWMRDRVAKLIGEARKVFAGPQQPAQSGEQDDEPLWDHKGNVRHEAVDRLGEKRRAASTQPVQTERALTEVGFIVHDDLHGWHFAPTVAWTYLGKGRSLYAMTAAQPASSLAEGGERE